MSGFERVDEIIKDAKGNTLARALLHGGDVLWAVQRRGWSIASGVVPPAPQGSRDVLAFLRGKVHEVWGRPAAQVELTDDDGGLPMWQPGVEVEAPPMPTPRPVQVLGVDSMVVVEIVADGGDAVVRNIDGTEISRTRGAGTVEGLRAAARRYAPAVRPERPVRVVRR